MFHKVLVIFLNQRKSGSGGFTSQWFDHLKKTFLYAGPGHFLLYKASNEIEAYVHRILLTLAYLLAFEECF